MHKPTLIAAEDFCDERGSLRAYNKFDMDEVKRMYAITPSDPGQIRAWQFHQKEKKYMTAIKGTFLVKAVKLKHPERSGIAETFSQHLDAARGDVWSIPPGYANGFRALTPGATLMVFSNMTLEESREDDIRIAIDKLKVNWEL